MEYCCKFMESQLTYDCPLHGPGDNCPDVVIARARFSGGDGKLILIAKNTEYQCNFCPNCVVQLGLINGLRNRHAAGERLIKCPTP